MSLSTPPKPPTSDGTSWRRTASGESTSAFRGGSRARGGRGAARGGPGGGPSPQVGSANISSNRPARGSEPEDKRAPTVPPASVSSSGLKTAAAEVKVPVNQDATGRPRAARRGSRQAASLAVDVSSPLPTDTSTTVPSTAPLPTGTSRRKRSQTSRNKAASSPVQRTATASPVSTRHSPHNAPILQAKKGVAAAGTTPAASVVSKDLPPHLAGLSERSEPVAMHSAPAEATTFDSRAQIESLVDKMRSNAIHRPYSPASHIDWAGDDDDELPDLDDWGYGSKTESSAEDANNLSLHNVVISPILEGSLKTLPVLEPEPAMLQQVMEQNTPSSLDDSRSATTAPTDAPDDSSTSAATPRKRASDASGQATPSVQPPREEKVKSRRGARTKGPKSTGASTPSAPTRLESHGTKDKSVPTQVATTATLPSKPEVGEQSAPHPSLPPKPVITAPDASRQSTADKLTPSPSSLNPSPAVQAASPVTPAPVHSAAASVITPSPPKQTLQLGLSASIHAPKPASIDQKPIAPVNPPKSVEEGVSASIHAPKSTTPQSAPSHITTNPSTQSPPTSTLAPNHHQRSHSRPAAGSTRLNDSSRSPTRHLNGTNHSRTQSTPVNHSRAPPHTRSPGNVRPVISGHALSQLMRTLGGPGAAPRGRAEAVASDK